MAHVNLFKRAIAVGEAAADNLNAVAEWAISLIELLGAPGVAVAIALENLFPPLPSELILPVAGFAASKGNLGLIEVIIWATIGSVAGALVLYGVGAWLGRERMRKLLIKVPLVSIDDVNNTEAWFDKHGHATVFFGRMVPIFRSLISIPAGVTRMSMWRFIPLTAAGSLIWNTIFIVAGFILGENWETVEEFADIFQAIVIAAILIAIVVFVFRRVTLLKRRRAGNRDDFGDPGS
jgi:membrane protein DedA with SNARE-associated domain